MESLQNVDPWAQAGLMIRESLAANANHATILASAGNGVVFRFPQIGQSRNEPVQGCRRHGAPPGCRPGPSGATFTASTLRRRHHLVHGGHGQAAVRPDGPGGPVAVASHNTAANTTAVLSNVAVGAPVSSNAAPAVTLTSPVSSTVLAPASMALAATASDSDGTVAGVDFYAGTTLLGTDTSSPYSWSWANVPAGTYPSKPWHATTREPRPRHGDGSGERATHRVADLAGRPPLGPGAGNARAQRHRR